MRSLVAVCRVAFYWTIKSLAWPVTRIYVRLRVGGLDKVPGRGACIVVANHASYVDPVVLGSAFPRRIAFLISAPMYRLKRLRWLYYMMGSIPVNTRGPDTRALKAALRTLQHGGVVGIFPEGQRTLDGRLTEGKAGVAMLAARSGAPVVPAAIVGAHRVMPVGSIVPRAHAVRVEFGSPISFPASNAGRPTREQLAIFADQVMNAIAALMLQQQTSLKAGGGLRSTT